MTPASTASRDRARPHEQFGLLVDPARGDQPEHPPDFLAVADEPVGVPISRRAGLMGASALARGALRSLAVAAGMATVFGAAPAAAQCRSNPLGGFSGTCNAQATGPASTAVGGNAQAFGTAATAYGNSALALGANATATGFQSSATGQAATATGQAATATGDNATATGQSANATGTTASAFGQGSVANGDATTAIGQASIASATGATAIGQGATASAS